MSRVNEELLPQLKPGDRKRQRLDFPNSVPSSLGCLIKMFGMQAFAAFLTSKHEFHRIKYSNSLSVRFRK